MQNDFCNPFTSRISGIFLLVVSLANLAVADDNRSHWPLNDAEVHLVDYFQQTEGAVRLLQSMDEAGIEHAFVMGLPVIKKWSVSEPERPQFVFGDDAPVYYYAHTNYILLKQWENLTAAQKKRVHPFLNGFNPTDMNAATLIERELNWQPGFWQGIGEVITRHDVLTALAGGERARANHPAMMKVYQLAAKHDLPVIVHSNITSEREKSPIYLAEMREAVAQNPTTRFIWAHGGTSINLLQRQKLTFLLAKVKEMLQAHDNLYILASWTLLDVMLDEQGQAKPDWLQLIADYPERFMIGSDVVGKFANQGKILKRWHAVLEHLPETVARQMAQENMLNVLARQRYKAE